MSTMQEQEHELESEFEHEIHEGESEHERKEPASGVHGLGRAGSPRSTTSFIACSTGIRTMPLFLSTHP